MRIPFFYALDRIRCGTDAPRLGLTRVLLTICHRAAAGVLMAVLLALTKCPESRAPRLRASGLRPPSPDDAGMALTAQSTANCLDPTVGRLRAGQCSATHRPEVRE